MVKLSLELLNIQPNSIKQNTNDWFPAVFQTIFELSSKGGVYACREKFIRNQILNMCEKTVATYRDLNCMLLHRRPIMITTLMLSKGCIQWNSEC